MTLHRRLRLATLALSVSLTVTFLLSAALLWWWASQWGALALLPAGVPTPPIGDGDLVPLCCYSAVLTLAAAALGEQYAVRLAGINGHEEAMPLARPEYAEGAPPASLPATLRWKTSRQIIEPVAMFLTVVAVLLGLLGIAMVVLAASMVTSGPIAPVIAIGGVGVVLVLLCGGIFLANARLLHPPTHGVVADERGIRRLTPHGEGPMLAWSDLRLFEVLGASRERQSGSSLLYRVTDTRGRETVWILAGPEKVEYVPESLTSEEVTDAVHALIWLARTRSGLALRTVLPQLEGPVEGVTPRATHLGLGIIKPILGLFAAMLVTLLAVGVLPFHGLLFPALNIVSAACLTLYALMLFGQSAWRWLDYQRQWLVNAATIRQVEAPIPTWLALTEAALALVGGALGWLAVYSAPVVGGAPAWLLGGFLMLGGMPAVTVIGWLLARRAWKRPAGRRRVAA
jgi:hypothetical protein